MLLTVDASNGLVWTVGLTDRYRAELHQFLRSSVEAALKALTIPHWSTCNARAQVDILKSYRKKILKTAELWG